MSVSLAESIPTYHVDVAVVRARRRPAWTRKPVGVAAGIVVLAVVIAAVAAPWLSPHPFAEQGLERTLLPPFWQAGSQASYWLGTDQLGRDLLSRLVWAARASLLVGVCSVLLGGTAGVAIGIVAGYAAGWLDDVLMRVVDVQLAFPPIFLAIAIMAVIGQSLLNVVIVLGAVTWVQYARVVRASTLSVKQAEFVSAARVVGAPTTRILLRHILPNALPPIIAIATVNVSVMILAEAGLSFLGLGIQPPMPSWGGMLAESRNIWSIAWWNALFPGVSILVTVLAINLFGDSLTES